jgi:peptidoglycan/LPS O-acetylase OafA/YrhL
MLLAFLVSPSMAGQRELTPLGVAADLLLLPHADAVLSISWTLRHEMVFYALFALALWFGPKAFWAIGAWIAISVAAGLYAAVAGVNTVPWMGSWSVVASTLNLGFGLGMIVAANLKTPAPSRAWPLIVLGGGLMLLLCVIEWVFGRGAPHDVDVLGPCGAIGLLLGAAALISGLVRLEAKWSMPAPRFWKAAGGSSYVLYLIHQPLASVAVRFLKRLPLSPEAMFVILAVSAVAAALVIHLTVETWLLKRLSGLGRRREPQTVANDTAPGPALASTTGFALTTPQPPGQSQG